MKLRDEWKWLVVIAAVGVAVYSNSLGGDFVYDDLRQIVRNPLIQNNELIGKALTSDVWAFKGDGTVVGSNYWRPTFTAWHILNFRLFGTEPAGWHAANIILHVLISLLIFLLLRRWDFETAPAFATALIFSVHPVHVESVAWISGSPDLLFTLSFLGSLWFATNYRSSRSTRDMILAAALYALAVGAKEIGILCIPIYSILVRREDGNTRGTGMLDRLTICIGVVAAVYFVVRWSVLGSLSRPPDDAVGLMDALLSIPAMFTFYLGQIFAPLWMAANYPLSPVSDPGLQNFVLPLVISLAALAGIAYLARSSRIALLGASIFLLPLIPAMNATAFISEQLVHDRYLYLPLLGVLMLPVPIATQRLGSRAVIIGSMAISALLAFQTVRYNTAWANDLALWSWTSAVDDSSFTSTQYASALVEAGRVNEAIQASTASLEKRRSHRGYLGRGRALILAKRYAEAEQDLLAAVAIPREDQEAYALYQTYEALGILYLEQGKYGAAIRNFTDARAALPIYSAAITEKLAVALYRAGQKDKALVELEAARAQARREGLPESKSVFLRLGMLYAELGRKDDARAALREFLSSTAKFADKPTLESRVHAARLLESIR